MALAQKGADYDYRDHIDDPHVKGALDDIASKLQAVILQGNYGPKGIPQPPSTPSALQVSVLGSLFSATIVHQNAPLGTRWILQYSTSPSFANPISEELGTMTWQKSLPSQALYLRVAAKFPASAQTPWVYAGSSSNPQRFQ